MPDITYGLKLNFSQRAKRAGLLLIGLIWVSFGMAYAAAAQNTFVARYQDRVAATLVNQPHWATPLVTVNARIEQGFRADFVRQTAPGGQKTWNYGNSKGLQFIPLPRTEIRISPPPFLAHYDGQSVDGFGDFAVRGKVRLYGSNEQHHNAIVTAELGATIPSGKNGNGSCCAILTPTLELGKGFGRFAITTSVGGSLPVSNTARLGRSLVWNNALQYHAARFLWIEDEFNSTFYQGGTNDGRQQTFNTPGIFLSRIPLLHGPKGKGDVLSLTLGVGEQIALTHFNTYNHSPILTARLRF